MLRWNINVRLIIYDTSQLSTTFILYVDVDSTSHSQLDLDCHSDDS